MPLVPAKRSYISGPVSGDPWETLEVWAQQSGFRVVEGAASSTRTYEKGDGWAGGLNYESAPMKVLFSFADGTMSVQAWVTTTFVARLFWLFQLPEEMHVNSGGTVMRLPRTTARTAINELLTQLDLGQLR